MMALEHLRLLAASLAVAFVATSCSFSTGDSNDPIPLSVAEVDNVGVDVQPGAAAVTDSGEVSGSSIASTTTLVKAPQDQDPQSQDPQGQDPQGQDPKAAETPQGIPSDVADQRKAVLVANWLDNARKLRMRGELQAAKMELLKAKDLAPTNEQARSELAAVQAELGEPVGVITTLGDEVMRMQKISEERARASVQTQLQNAQAEMASKNFAGAIEELRRAALAIEIKSDIDWMGLPDQVTTAKDEAERLYDEQQRADQAAQNAQLADQLRREYERNQARKRAQVDGLIQQSQVAFEARQFERSQDFAQRALDMDPSNGLAYEMLNAATKASRDSANDDYWRRRALEIRQMLESHEELKTPQTDVLVMDSDTWARANQRTTRSTDQRLLSPEDAAITKMVETAQVGRLTYTEETGAYLDVLKNLSLITGIDILTTPEARTVIDDETLTVVIELASSMTLKDFLNYMVGQTENLAWAIRDGVVLVGDKSQASGTLVTEIYPVKDLIFQQTQFLPPTIRDIPTEDSGDVPRTGGEGDDPIAGIELTDLVDTLTSATDPAYWEGEGVEIRAEDSGLLSVTASPEMQDKLVMVLKNMRRFQTPIVTIDSKFLTISRNFLQEIGIDIRGLGGSGNKGDTVSLDDITNGLANNASRGQDNGGTGDPAANPLAGAFFNDGSDGDIRARTENYFVNDLGRVLSPTGGLTAGWTLIDDTQLNLILRAVEKRQDGEIVNSQILSVVNRGRGHVAVINQTAYVRDFDVEVAQAAFIADPKVDVIQDGIVLDVQPIIQNDRKYITLNLNPTVAELQRPIPTFTTSLAGSTLPVTVQLPNLTVTNFSTTVKVPDGGTVLLGGLRQVLTRERRAEVPLFSRLPLISFLFKQEGSADENRSLMVMVRAQVTDLGEDGR